MWNGDQRKNRDHASHSSVKNWLRYLEYYWEAFEDLLSLGLQWKKKKKQKKKKHQLELMRKAPKMYNNQAISISVSKLVILEQLYSSLLQKKVISTLWFHLWLFSMNITRWLLIMPHWSKTFKYFENMSEFVARISHLYQEMIINNLAEEKLILSFVSQLIILISNSFRCYLSLTLISNRN